jgi:Fur family ferric uptake transcriptional regulator
MNTPLVILKSHKLKATHGRIKTLETLLKSPHPLSAETLHLSLRQTADLSTIYRTLKEFSSKGIVDTLYLEKNKVLYEIKSGRAHHHHIVCTKCNKVEDVKNCEIESVSSKILSKSEFFNSISKHTLEFFGTCNKCSKKSLS